MNQKFEKLKNLLKELFQLDQPDLDFGLYRIMHAKSAEVTQFLDRDLLPQVAQAFSLYKNADKAELEKELATAIAQAQSLGADPETLPKVKELRIKLANDAVDISALENEVYDHLYSFFRRYYSDGDFYAKRVYKPGVYAIPYEGQEVTLYWANRDQYYIKTSEYLRDYTFRLRPDDPQNPMRVHFRLVDAAEAEHGNVKATEGKDRIFILAAAGESGRDFITEVDGDQGKELNILFEYRPATLADWPEEARLNRKTPPAQKELRDIAAQRLMRIDDALLVSWVAELGRPHTIAAEGQLAYSRLDAHLRRYVARNTFDYFIHTDLSSFLDRELDFFIKNEVMHLDDVENESAPRVEQYLSKIKVVRMVAKKIIDFLAQLEDFQKRLWLKKKFVIETQYCITLDRIPENFYPEIASNDAQREEWIHLFEIDRILGDLTTPAYSIPLTKEFLEANKTLVVDTRHFTPGFVELLVDHTEVLRAGGFLLQAENGGALRLLRPSVRNTVKCIYIDPPFNTGDDGFLYKDNYQHSSWCCLLLERLHSARYLLAEDGCIAISIDQVELGTLQALCDEVFGRSNRLPMITVKRGSVTGHKVINPGVVNISEYVLCYAKNRSAWIGNEVFAQRERDERYSTFILNRDKDPSKWSFTSLLEEFSSFTGVEKARVREHLGDRFEEEMARFVADHADAVTQPVTVDRAGVGIDFLNAVLESERRPNEVMVHHRESYPDVYLVAGKKLIFYSDKLVLIGDRRVTAERASDIWTDVLPNDLHNEGGVELRKGKKPEALVARLLEMGSNEGDVILDFFAGSGTAPASAQKCGRRWIAVEMAPYFDDKPLRRMKNVLFGEGRGVSQNYGWQGGGAFKYARLESYEDTLNNLDTRRTPTQQSLLDAPDAQGENGFWEQFLLRYMLDVETLGSQSLLNVRAFQDPTAYKLKVKQPGSDESREVNVDLLETFNWLIGLSVKHIAAPQSFSAEFERDTEKRLRIKGRIKQEAAGPWWFRTVMGTTPDGRRTLIIWRKLTGNIEQDNLVLDEWFTKQGYSTKDFEFQVIYVNGDNNLENLKAPDDTWKVRLIEEDFHRLMFDTEGV